LIAEITFFTNINNGVTTEQWCMQCLSTNYLHCIQNTTDAIDTTHYE